MLVAVLHSTDDTRVCIIVVVAIVVVIVVVLLPTLTPLLLPELFLFLVSAIPKWGRTNGEHQSSVTKVKTAVKNNILFDPVCWGDCRTLVASAPGTLAPAVNYILLQGSMFGC